MHELGITQNIVSIVAEHAQNKKVKRVQLQIGKLSAIMPEAIQFCFDICSQGTVLQGAILEILESPGLAKCRQCGAEIPLEKLYGNCHCGSNQLDLISGEELKIKEIEIEEVYV